MKKAYALHPGVLQDLREIHAYIALDSLDAADQVFDDIMEGIRALVPFPHQGHKRPDLTVHPLRFARVYDYLIAYAPDKKPLWVVAVLHGRRDPKLLAAILRSRE